MYGMLPTIKEASDRLRKKNLLRLYSKQNKKFWCIHFHFFNIFSFNLQIFFLLVLNGEIVQFNLADIGEGIAEVQVTEWYSFVTQSSFVL